jgi:hypothetical protein
MGLHGSTTPSAQASAPNIATRSWASKDSSVDDPGKFANANPFSSGRNFPSIGAEMSTETADPLHELTTAARAKRRQMCFI